MLDTTPNRFVPGELTLDAATQAAIQRRSEVMGPSYRLIYANPLHFVRGEGIWLYDTDGNAYLDFYNNVASLGHCHPRVVEAMARQASMLSTNTRYLHDGIIEYSERLLDCFPDHLSQAMFACTGSEANDLACRIAKFHTGGEGFIITEYAYHGTSNLISSLSPNLGPSVPIHPNARTVPAPRTVNGGDVGAKFTDDVQAAIDDLVRHGVKPAALLVDSIFASDGVFAEPRGFLKGAVEAIHKAGGLFISDEVQPGFARTGDHMWGFERHGIAPDIVTLGKPMGNGYPMAGLVARADVIAEFGAHARYFNTFAGNTVASANGLAVLDVIRDENLLENARTVGAYVQGSLSTLSCERFGDIRCAGLYVGLEMVTDQQSMAPDREAARKIVNGLREKRVLISLTGKHENVLKIRPPLIAECQHVDRFIEVFQSVLRDAGYI